MKKKVFSEYNRSSPMKINASPNLPHFRKKKKLLDTADTLKVATRAICACEKRVSVITLAFNLGRLILARFTRVTYKRDLKLESCNFYEAGIYCMYCG